jgi:arylsulfatase A-like enzyme
VLGLLSACAPADIPLDRDLAAEVEHAEVCALDLPRCVQGRRARELHDVVGMAGDDLIALPPDSSSNVYLRLPSESRVAFAFRAIGATLTLVAEPSGRRPMVLFRSERTAADDQWHTVDSATGLPAGTIVRLGFEVRPLVPGRPAMCRLEEPRLRGRRPAPARPRGTTVAAKPNVVLYVIDTLRADRLGCYGHAAPTSPRIDAFAAQAIRFTHTVAQSSWTRPSTASIFTGRVPPRHGATEAANAIHPDVPTLPELLHGAGYATGAFVTNSVASAPFGFARGFDRFGYFPETPSRATLFLPADRLLGPIARWLRRTPRPFFLYVHTTDPHNPYLPPPRFRRALGAAGDGAATEAVIEEQRRCQNCLHDLARQHPVPIGAGTVAILSGLYDAEVARADAAFGRLLDLLAEAHLLDDTLIVLTADHGEEFLEHGGLTHGKTLYGEVLHVPLVVRLPGGVQGGTTEARVVQHADLLPSILDVAGLPIPPGLDGEAILSRDGPPPAREILSHLDHDGIALAAITDDRRVFIGNLADPERFEIFDLPRDPREEENLAGRDPILAAYGADRLAEILASGAISGPAVGPRELERLRALGYVGP